jgi:hypothetical protein
VWSTGAAVLVALPTGLLVVFGGGLMSVLEPQTVRGGYWDGI